MLDADPAVLWKPPDAVQPALHRRAAVFDLEHQIAAEQAEPFDRAVVSDQRDQRPRARLQQALRHPVLMPEGRGGAVPREGILPGEHLEAARILVVDDDPRTLRSVRDTLAGAGYAPLVTGEPGDLAQIIRSEKPRLVLLDLVLPGQNGIELTESVPELSDLPVIFISGYGRTRSGTAGASPRRNVRPVELASARSAPVNKNCQGQLHPGQANAERRFCRFAVCALPTGLRPMAHSSLDVNPAIDH